MTVIGANNDESIVRSWAIVLRRAAAFACGGRTRGLVPATRARRPRTTVVIRLFPARPMKVPTWSPDPSTVEVPVELTWQVEV
ncbi:hypothetical protein [Pseudonocardia sp. DLS-67]